MGVFVTRALLVLVAFAACATLSAQTLTVTNSPNSPSQPYLESGTAFDQPLIALRCSAAGGDVDLSGFTLTTGGTGGFTTDVTGMAVWLDDGDGVFDSATDQSLWTGTGGATVPVSFSPWLTITSGTPEDLWIVASFAPSAGSSLGKSYQVEVASAGDVSVEGGATASLGTPLPQSTSIELIEFSVTTLDHRCYWDQLVLYGSGFTPPVEMYVGGQLISATATVNASHTEVVFDYIEPNPYPTGDILEVSTASLGRKDTGYALLFKCYGGRSYAADVGYCSTSESSSPYFGLLVMLLGISAVLCTRLTAPR